MKDKSLILCFTILIILCFAVIVGAKMLGQQQMAASLGLVITMIVVVVVLSIKRELQEIARFFGATQAVET